MCSFQSTDRLKFSELNRQLCSKGTVSHVQDLPVNLSEKRNISLIFLRIKNGLNSVNSELLQEFAGRGGRLIICLEASMRPRYLSSVNAFLENYGISVCIKPEVCKVA